MNTTTKNIIRAIIILALGATALIGIFSEPSDTSASWYLDFIASKGIGILALLTLARLSDRWSAGTHQ